jgi:hypothetical protein
MARQAPKKPTYAYEAPSAATTPPSTPARIVVVTGLTEAEAANAEFIVLGADGRSLYFKLVPTDN